MRLVTFTNRNGEERLGALFDNDSQVADLARAHLERSRSDAPELASMLALIEVVVAAMG